MLSYLIKTKKGNLTHYYDLGNFIGFTLSVNFDEFTCLAFFATDPKYRNQGYGKKILDIYFQENEKQTIFLNCEVPENIDKENIKYRRICFYKRNSFKATSLIMSYKNIDYLTLVNKQIDNEKLNKLFNILVKFGCTCRFDTKVTNL